MYQHVSGTYFLVLVGIQSKMCSKDWRLATLTAHPGETKQRSSSRLDHNVGTHLIVGFNTALTMRIHVYFVRSHSILWDLNITGGIVAYMLLLVAS